MGIPVASSLVACLGAGAGVSLTGARKGARLLIPFSGGVLLGVAVFGLLPELSIEMGWVRGLACFVLGYVILLLIDRYVYPVCPTCSHDHDHTGCATALHGFAAPLISATALHSFLDGWNIAAAQSGSTTELRITIPLAILLHKVPEGVALGALMLASLRSRGSAFAWCIAAESLTVAGAAVALTVAPVLGVAWMGYPLALAGGFFLYLGLHAVHEEWRRRGAIPAMMPALTGAVGVAALQQGIRALIH